MKIIIFIILTVISISLMKYLVDKKGYDPVITWALSIIISAIIMMCVMMMIKT